MYPFTCYPGYPVIHFQSPSMLIRRARPKESKRIASYIILVMKEILYQFIGDNNPEKVLRLMESLTSKKKNQYSYKNCWVAEQNSELVATALVYDGAKLEELRKPVGEEILHSFNRHFNPENETGPGPGEFYIDSVAVHPACRGKGLGSYMLRFLMSEYVDKGNKTPGLLVDKNNPQAKKFYLRLGFRVVGEKTLAGKTMVHLQYRNHNQ